MKQYEVWWADLAEPAGRRPVLLLSRDAAYRYLSHVIVAEVTTRIRVVPQEVGLGRREGLLRPSVANMDSIASLAKEQLRSRLGGLRRARHVEVKRALGYVLGWHELVTVGSA